MLGLFTISCIYITSLGNLSLRFPVWPYIKIIAICWLVIPRFTRAYHAYKHLVQIRSYANLQVVINWLNKQDKEHLPKREETFLSVAEKYIKENGSEALEELIANKSKGAEPNLDAKEKMAVTITEKKEMAKTTEIQSKGPKPDVEEIKAAATTEKKEMATIEVMRANANLAETLRKIVEAVEVKEMNMPAAAAPSGENYSSSSDNVQRQWTCAVCQVITTSETILNSHLQGKKHIAKCEELKARKQTPKNKSSFSSTTNNSEQANQNPNNCESGDGLNQSNSKTRRRRKRSKVQEVDTSFSGVQA